VPLLVVGGDRGIVAKLEANRAIANEVDGARMEVIQGVNHMGPMERADLYNRLIADFTLGVQPSATVDVRSEADEGTAGGGYVDGPESPGRYGIEDA
jgi:hypothetical protein